MIEDSTRYLQYFLLCSNNEIAACTAGCFNSFGSPYMVAFLKVMQQQTICKVANWITYLWADNFCLQQWNFFY